MASDGSGTPNLINWFIGYILLYIWMISGYLVGIFGMWQIGLDGALGTIESFAMNGVGSTYKDSMTVAM